MNIINEDLLIIKKRLEETLNDSLSKDLLRDFITSGSKFVRSSLAILYLKAQNVEISKNIMNVLVAGEIIHNASLLHDDVLDNAQTRRGDLTLAQKYDANLAILAGDYLLSLVLDTLLCIKNFEIIEIFKNCTKKMTEAEIKQYFLRNKNTLRDDYLEICKGKTASLFSAILESTAILANISKDSARHMGELFGLCFQINNDLKLESASVDKKNGIQTAQDILGIEKTTALLDNYKEEMRDILKAFPPSVYKKGLEDLIISL